MVFNVKLIVGLLWPLIVCFVAAATEVRHLQINNAHLIETSQSNFGLTAPVLVQNGWRTVSVNGYQVSFISDDCRVSTKNIDSLSPSERQLLLAIKQQLGTAESGQPQLANEQVTRSGSTRYTFNSGPSGSSTSSSTSSYARNINLSSFNSNQLSITKYADDNFSVARPNLPNNIARLFVSGPVVTFVYRDGQVLMKPTACLQPQEAQIVQQLKQELQQAERQFNQSMQQFHQNMQNMQHNLQQNMQNMNNRLNQNMQNMHQNLNNMFGNMFQSGASQMAQYPQQPAGGYAGGYTYGDSDGPYGIAQTMSGSLPFGQANSPFWPGFPFRR